MLRAFSTVCVATAMLGVGLLAACDSDTQVFVESGCQSDCQGQPASSSSSGSVASSSGSATASSSAGGATASSGQGGAGGMLASGGAGQGGDPLVGQLPDFSLSDVNATSATIGMGVSPRDYLGQVSAWYFTHAT
jgi:hypothetical protein